MDKIKFAFFGTPEVATSTLDILKKNGHTPSLIITTPDKKSGRKLKLKPSPVSMWAENNQIKCLKPEKLDQDFLEILFKLTKEKSIELYVVVAYGKILPEDIIEYPKFKSVNIHYSLLPKYRGASPLESAILSGEKETGVTLQEIKHKLDSGPILSSKKIDLGLHTLKIDLEKKLIEEGAYLLLDMLSSIKKGGLQKTEQEEERVTYCKKIKKEDGLIDINDDDLINWNKYRAYQKWPSVYFFINKNNKNIRIKVTKASFVDGNFVIEKIIPEGKKEVDYQNFLKEK